ncbi:hypothetical protein GCM10009557_70120 [Virgisporangium ochraceum]
MPAPGRVSNGAFSGAQRPPASVPSNAGTAAVASARPPVEILLGLGRRLVARREQRGMTRRDLADCVNYSEDAVAHIEGGRKPGPRSFWALADRALDAGGSLLGDADRSLLSWAAAMQDYLRNHHHAARRAAGPGRAMPSRTLVVDRAFADQLGAISVQGRRHPGMLAAAERNRPRVERELAALTDAVRILIRRTDFADPEIFTSVWQTLLRHDPRHAALLSAIAIVELASSRQHASKPRDQQREATVTTSTREAPTPAGSCPPWCQAHHADPQVIDHVRLVDAVHNKPVGGSVAVEIEQAAGRDPQIEPFPS